MFADDVFVMHLVNFGTINYNFINDKDKMMSKIKFNTKNSVYY